MLHDCAARRQEQGRWSAWPAASTGRRGSSPRTTWRAASGCGKFSTVPARGEFGSDTWAGDSAERGGGGVWVTGGYDPALNLLYLRHRQSLARLPRRQSARATTCSRNTLVALDGDTGKRRWHYQFTPHDTHDWDSTHVPILGELTINGRERAGRDGGQSQRLLLHDRSDQRRAAGRQAVRAHHLGEGDRPGRPAGAAARTTRRTKRAR